ncbi:dimethylsulfoniopropionate lyase DddW [Aliiruegeria haliotis]|uniref:Dimethylsulfoniopropionate lyase DddW n=1 Tax=Aliiruegeria haliotis TaxID=1280846 RepID=A0A2T0S060_9RHOB|nr:cupin domain-containing protein [Aliiruegeria haliotis]PRY26818.1 dimethylsulfoniopropionate lyase DddW [Aliiruegeria haliotis]
MSGIRQTSTVVVHTPELPLEQFQDPTFGSVKWRTLFTADRTCTDHMTCGVAYLNAGDSLNLHRHEQAEVYFGLFGRVRVMVDDLAYDLLPGTAIFIPGLAVHGAFAQDEPASFFYTFATGCFSDVRYVAHAAANDPGRQVLASASPSG